MLPPIIIKVEPIAAMLAPQVGGWGLGFELQGENASARFAHSGSNAGYRCLPVAYASKGQGAVVMTNADRGAALSAEIMRSIAGEYGWLDYLPKEKVIAPIDPKILDDYVGQYQSVPDRIITITNENGKLMANPLAGAKVKLFAESDTDFFLKQAAVQIRFVKDTEGKVTGVVLRQGGREILARKVK